MILGRGHQAPSPSTHTPSNPTSNRYPAAHITRTCNSTTAHTNNPTSPTNNYGLPLTTTRYQNCTPQTNTSHGPGVTITKAGFYILYMSFLYDPAAVYIYSGWCVNGSQIHHWHSNHAVASNHDAVSSIGVYLNIGDHVTIENSNQSITTIYGNAHSSWYISKIG